MTRSGLRVAAVVVTHNRLAHLKLTLTRLLDEPLDCVMVVDNASTDATAAWLARQHDPRLRVLRLDDNRGGAGGFEAGMIALGRDVDPDWTVLMDDDARPHPGAIAAFREAARDIDPAAPGPHDIGVVAAAVVYPDGQVCEMNRPLYNPLWHVGAFLRTLVSGTRRGFHLPDDAILPATPGAPRPPPVDIDGASFVGFFVNRGAVARIGVPEGGLFIYGDDVLYCLKLRRAGLRCRLVPDILFEHDCSSLGAGLVTRPLWKVYYLCRNGVSVARQASGPILFPFTLLYYMMRWSGKAVHYDPAERALYRHLMWTGIRDGLRGRRGRNDAIHGLSDARLAGRDQTGRTGPAE